MADAAIRTFPSTVSLTSGWHCTKSQRNVLEKVLASKKSGTSLHKLMDMIAWLLTSLICGGKRLRFGEWSDGQPFPTPCRAIKKKIHLFWETNKGRDEKVQAAKSCLVDIPWINRQEHPSPRLFSNKLRPFPETKCLSEWYKFCTLRRVFGFFNKEMGRCYRRVVVENSFSSSVNSRFDDGCKNQWSESTGNLSQLLQHVTPSCHFILIIYSLIWRVFLPLT